MLLSKPGETAYPKMTDSFSTLIFFYDPLHKKIIFSNMPVENFFGSTMKLGEDLPFSFIIDKKDERNINIEWQTCLELKEKQIHQFWVNKKLSDSSGIIFHFSAEGIKIENNPGSASCILFTVEKLPSGENAAWMVEAERLRKLLDRYKEEYAEFIDIAAHNLDAPLRKLTVLVDRLTNKKSNTKEEEINGYVTRIRASLDDMRSLIDSLATLSRFTTAPMKIDSCPMETIVEHEWRELRQAVKEKNATINVGTLPVIDGDAAQYRHLFKELLENSLRFYKRNTVPAITISSQPVTLKEKNAYGLQPATDYCKIEVRDNGIGFRQEYAEKIFRPFVRLHGKSEYPGNGIGLALCRSIVNNHRGVIYAESNEDEGARFILLLPQTII